MFNDTLWQSKTNGRKRVILMLTCLVLLVPSLIFVFISSNNGDDELMLISICLTGIVIIASIVALILGHFTSLKWDVTNLEFAVAESGLYFASLANQSTYFHAEWSEIESYSFINYNNGLTTVTVYFTAPLDAGSVGKIKYLKMVKISDFDTLKTVFSGKNVKEFAAR